MIKDIIKNFLILQPEMKVALQKTYCDKSPDKAHRYIIVKKSGNKTGIPTWKCEHCSKKVISS